MEIVANDPAAGLTDLPARPADNGGPDAPAEPPRTATARRPGPLGDLLDVPPDADAATLRALAESQADVLQREDEVHRFLLRTVLEGGSVEALCGRLVHLLGGAVLVTTTDGRVLAEAGPADALAAAHGSGAFDRTGRLVVEEEPVGIRRPSPGRGEDWTHRATVRIVAGSGEEGRLAVFSDDRPLGAVDIHLMERAATVAALVLVKEQAVSAVESKYRAEFLRDALAGRAGAGADAVAHAESLGWTLADRMVVVVAETDEDDTETTRAPDEVRALQQRFTRAWMRAMEARDPRAPVMGFSQEVVALFAVPEDADTDQITATVTEVCRVVSGDGGGGRRTFSTGVSRPVTSVAGLPAAYDEALKAVSVGRQVSGHSAITPFDGLGIFRLLALVPDSADLRRFVTESLGELATDDVPENVDLRNTLSVLIDANMNVAEAARTLYFHYNTLRYRITKLERMLGPFTTDPQLRLTLALALRIVQMRGLQ